MPSFIAMKLAPISIEIHVKMVSDHFGPISTHSFSKTFEGTFDSINLSAIRTQEEVLLGRWLVMRGEETVRAVVEEASISSANGLFF
jgi:hypothetical protein